MRISLQQKDLSKALAIVSRSVATRSTMPVLSNVLLEANGNLLRVAAMNREIATSCWTPAKIEEAGSITVPARLLTEFVNSLPPERVDLTLNERTQTLTLECGRMQANIKGIDAKDFPLIATISGEGEAEDGAMQINGSALELDPATLRKMIDQVVFAASTDESRPTFTGVEITLGEARLGMVATDGYRLSVRSTSVDNPVESNGGGFTGHVVVPARSLGEVALAALPPQLRDL
ncbi:MAG TPA: DNA polymerase III subunit beta, partial [Caldilineaceae bacterium]|nr:DNA polymerase III subunit beta [Caldilineaceae bacterium]